MKKIALYLALSFAGLCPATAVMATTPAAAVSLPVSSPVVAPQKKEASYGRRFGAYLMELIPYWIAFSYAISYQYKGNFRSQTSDEPAMKTDFLVKPAAFIILTAQLIRIAWNIYPKSGGVGKYLLGMKVVDEKGADADYGKVVFRAIIENLPTGIFYLIATLTKSSSIGAIGVSIACTDIFLSFITMFTGRFYWDRITRTYVVLKEK